MESNLLGKDVADPRWKFQGFRMQLLDGFLGSMNEELTFSQAHESNYSPLTHGIDCITSKTLFRMTFLMGYEQERSA